MSVDIPNTDSVVRHCNQSEVQDGRVQPKAFYFKGNDDKCVSVNWLEEAHRVYNESSSIESVRTALRRNRTLRPSHILAELHIDAAKRVVLQLVGRNALCVKHDPTSDASHACMAGYNESDLGSNHLYKAVAAELSLLANDQTHPAVV